MALQIINSAYYVFAVEQVADELNLTDSTVAAIIEHLGPHGRRVQDGTHVATGRDLIQAMIQAGAQ